MRAAAVARASTIAAIAKDGVASLAPAEDGGVWLGDAKGLYLRQRQGRLGRRRRSRIRSARSCAITRAGCGSRRRTGWSRASRPARRCGSASAQGCAIVAPRLLVERRAIGVMVIGADAAGPRAARDRQAARVDDVPHAARGASGTRRRGAETARRDGRRPGLSHRRARTTARAAAVARRDAARADRQRPTPSDWVIDPIDAGRAAGRDVARRGRRSAADRHARSRHRALSRRRRAAARLAAPQADVRGRDARCRSRARARRIAGSRRARGRRGTGTAIGSSPGGPDQVVLAVVRDPAGPIYALHRAAGRERRSTCRGSTARRGRRSRRSRSSTPGDAPEISFARFAVDGLAVGRAALSRRRGAPRVRHRDRRDRDGQGRVSPHRGGAPTDKKAEKMLPIPVGVVDADVRGEHGVVRDERRASRGSRDGEVDAVDRGGWAAQRARARGDDRARRAA